ncbi:hypothetical protein ASPCADRAFT_204660 [Aspergillus carbonarius ITEM 5010]|uniref:Rhodopsin domain-containing protein n=1 Tax=Aspergillus carbonarius (strain ITEM 5010) TaxID=602072 RepID=A0A1R3RWU4_ASPC5|nr:hypothetical protein ASPCADRAFT_204660 [Aspergillus carbonarius ITEM 5010]
MGSSVTNPSGLALERGMWAAVAVATVIIILRIIAKIKIHHFRFDDVLMVIAWALTLASTVILTLSVQNGFGTNLEALPLHNTEQVLKYIAIQVPLVTISTGLARSSFVLYLLGILGGKKNYSIALWFAMLLQLSANIVSAVLPLCICRNVRALWDPYVKTTCGSSVAVVRFSYFSSSVNTATDLFLAVFPTIIFWSLNLKMRIKISLIMLLSLGVVAMVASIIKTTKLDEVPSITNLGAGGAVGLIRWGYSENLIIIITSSVPCIRPLLISSVRKLSSAARSRSYELSGPFSANKGTTKNGTAPSRLQEQQSSDNRDDCDSIEQILKDSYHTGSTMESGRGIKKQVEISVVSNHSNHKPVRWGDRGSRP